MKDPGKLPKSGVRDAQCLGETEAGGMWGGGSVRVGRGWVGMVCEFDKNKMG